MGDGRGLVGGVAMTTATSLCQGCNSPNMHTIWCPTRHDVPQIGEWIARGNCAGTDMEPDGRIETLKLKLVCLLCPVKEQCLRYACANADVCDNAIWGAASRSERRSLGRKPTDGQIERHFERVADTLQGAGL